MQIILVGIGCALLGLMLGWAIFEVRMFIAKLCIAQLEKDVRALQADVDFYKASWQSQRTFSDSMRQLLINRLGARESELPSPPVVNRPN